MILYSIPFSTEKNIGAYYNYIMSTLQNDSDFACFVDADTIFTTSNFGDQILDVVKRYPECGLFTCYTNRVGFKKQIYPMIDMNNNDMQYHRDIGKSLQETYWNECEDLSYLKQNELISGMLLLVKKSLWKAVGGFKSGMLSVDNDFHLKCIQNNEKVYLMKGVYIYHWYRWPNYSNTTHLKPNNTKPISNVITKKNKKVVYTCIVNDYDLLRDPLVVNPEWDYVCFSDKKIPSNVWAVKEIPNDCLNEDSKKIQRKIKLLPHKYLSEYEESIWIDGNLEMLVDPEHLITESEYDVYKAFSVLAHPERQCLYDELDSCESLGKDSKESIDTIRKLLFSNRYPKKHGLVQTSIIIRNHKNDSVIALCDFWWEFVKKHSHRDQTLFNYVVWKYPNLGRIVNMFSANCLQVEFNFYTHSNGIESILKPKLKNYGFIDNYINGRLMFDSKKYLSTRSKYRLK